jgi:hypothetical protein
MPYQQSDDHIAHFGVKGMRWGVRKAIDRIKGTGKDTSNDPKPPPPPPKPKAHELSDEELRKSISRLNLENNYSRLMAEQSKLNRGPVAKGRDFAIGIVEKAATEIVSKAIKKTIEKQGEKALGSGFKFMKNQVGIALASTDKSAFDILNDLRSKG